MNWLKENWFKLALLILAFWLLFILQNGVKILHKGEIEHGGFIENARSRVIF